MEKYTDELYAEMISRLQEAAIGNEEELQLAERSFRIVQETMKELKAYIKQENRFTSIAAEIRFFKEVKPKFHRELIYHAELIHILVNKPLGPKKSVIKYYEQLIAQMQAFFKRQHLLYTYYRVGHTDQDELLFVRDSDCIPLIPDDTSGIDTSFCTLNGSIIAKLLAFERVIEYLQHKINQLKNGETVNARTAKNRLVWTDSKSSLIELAYALHARGSINNGKGDVKMIMNTLEQVLNVEVGNFYRTFQGMRIRKKSRTPYIDSLGESLEHKMDEGWD